MAELKEIIPLEHKPRSPADGPADPQAMHDVAQRLRESEARFRTIFACARVSLWEEDFSSVIELLDELRAAGVVDLCAYLTDRPDVVTEAMRRVRVLDVNDYTLELYEAEAKAELLAGLEPIFVPDTFRIFVEELLLLWEGGRKFEGEARARTLTGKAIDIGLTIAFDGERGERALVSIFDISARKAADRRLEALNAIGRTIAAELDIRRIMQIVTDSARELSGARFGAFFFNSVGEQGEQLTLYTLSGAPPEAFERFGIPRNTLLFEQTFRGLGIVRADDVRKDPRYGGSPPHHGMPPGHLPVVSYLAVPVVSGSGKVHGGLFFGHEEAGVFTEESERLTAGLAAHAAVALDNAQALADAERELGRRRQAEAAAAQRLKEQAALYAFIDRLYRADALPEFYEASLDAIVEALRCPRASVSLFDGAGVLRSVSSHGLGEAYRASIQGYSPWGAGPHDPQPVLIDDAVNANLDAPLKAALAREGIAALGVVPVTVRGRLAGKLVSGYDQPRAFSETEISLLLTIARQLGFALERWRGQEALKESEARERERASELETMMEAAPALIWIARDSRCERISGNRMSQEFLRLPPDANPSLSAPSPERPSHFEVYADGRRLAPDELPVQRAARGEEVRDFEEEVRFSDGSSRWLLGNATPLRDASGGACGAVAAFVDITERRRVELQRQLLVNELNHRVKNTLATVQSLARQTLHGATDASEAFAAFEARIAALARAHDLLTRESWRSAALRDVADQSIEPFSSPGRFVIEGPGVRLTPKQALAVSMALYELATNAAKYGALATETGVVDIRWAIERNGQDSTVMLEWRESGGPPVVAPSRAGFGSRLINRSLAHDLGAAARIEFNPEGVVASLRTPLQSLDERDRA